MSRDTFERWSTPPGTSLGVCFKPGEPRCGIYIVEFRDGDRYVGQAIDVIRRFSDHRRRWEGIIGIQFRAVPREGLNDAERQMVRLVEATHCVRNINGSSQMRV